MTQDEIIEMARQVGYTPFEALKWEQALTNFAKLVAAKEREAIAQMFEDAPALVAFAQNDQGGCLMCGFTPKMALNAIRARGEA